MSTGKLFKSFKSDFGQKNACTVEHGWEEFSQNLTVGCRVCDTHRCHVVLCDKYKMLRKQYKLFKKGSSPGFFAFLFHEDRSMRIYIKSRMLSFEPSLTKLDDELTLLLAINADKCKRPPPSEINDGVRIRYFIVEKLEEVIDKIFRLLASHVEL